MEIRMRPHIDVYTYIYIPQWRPAREQAAAAAGRAPRAIYYDIM